MCPRHQEKYAASWRTGKVWCSIPSEIAGHKSSSAKGDCGIGSKESAFILTAGKMFLPMGRHKKIIKINFLTSLLLCRACKCRQFPSANFIQPKTIYRTSISAGIVCVPSFWSWLFWSDIGCRIRAFFSVAGDTLARFREKSFPSNIEELEVFLRCLCTESTNFRGVKLGIFLRQVLGYQVTEKTP